jgi:hypothetical protein
MDSIIECVLSGVRGLLLLCPFILMNAWLSKANHAFMSIVEVFSSFVMLSLPCVFVRDGLPSVEM